MKESKLQSELKKSAEATKGIGVKINPAWTKGVSDLYLAHQGAAAWVECKIEKKHLKTADEHGEGPIVLNDDPSIKVALTPLQRKRIRDFRKAGLVAGWCVAYRMNGDWYAIMGVEPMVDRVKPLHSPNIIMRGKGSKWDAVFLINRLRALHEGTAVADDYITVKL